MGVSVITMPSLELKRNKDLIGVFPLELGKLISIGRSNDNDVVINDPAVSGHHAKIEPVNNSYLLSDLRSRNGTFLNQQFITAQWLKPGDIISIGEHTLIYKTGLAAEAADNQQVDLTKPMAPATAGGDQTMVIDTQHYREMRSKSFLEVATRKTEKQKTAMLYFIHGGEGYVELGRKEMWIGKDKSCDVRIKGIFVGKKAAVISKRADGFFITYQSGMAKPVVNDTPLKKTVLLKESDIIKIGPTKLLFIYSKPSRN